MKLLVVFIVSIISTISLAQNGFNYKAIIKDGTGNVLVNQTIDLEFSIIKSTGAVEVYKELHSDIVTDSNGLIILNIGEGNPISGNFLTIKWGNDTYFLETQIDTGSGMVYMGTTEFKEVPLATASKSISEMPSRTLKVEGTGQQTIKINSTSGNISSLELQRSGSSTDWKLQNSSNWLDIISSDNDFTSSSIKFSFDKNGKLGINNNTPIKELDVTGTIRSSVLSGAGNRKVSANPSGDLIIDTTPTTYYISLGSNAFWSNSPDAYKGLDYLSGNGPIFWRAPVNLPDNAIVTKLKFYYLDNRVLESVKATIYADRVDLDIFDSGGLEVIGSILSNGFNTTIQATESGTLYHLVNNQLLTYWIELFAPNGWSQTSLRVYGVIITYIIV